MATSEERIRVLRMVEEGKLGPDEAAKLLAALTESAKTAQGAPRSEQTRSAGASPSPRGALRARRLRVKVSSSRSGKNKNIDIDLPVGAVRVLNTVLTRLGAKSTISAGAQAFSAQDVVDMVDSGVLGRIVDIRGDDGEHVEVILE
jgi:hypothetical protein